jgi:ribosomal protein S14
LGGWGIGLGIIMLSSKIKDIKFRCLFNKLEKQKIINKFIFTNLCNKKDVSVSEKINWVTLKGISNKKYISKVRITRRCVFNNRSRGVVRSFGISRIYLRELMQFGMIPGYTKAVW